MKHTVMPTADVDGIRTAAVEDSSSSFLPESPITFLLTARQVVAS